MEYRVNSSMCTAGTMYDCLYAFIRAVQGACIEVHHDPFIYAKEAYWSVLVPPSREFVSDICAACLNVLLADLQLDVAHCCLFVKFSLGRDAFDID